MMKKNEEENNPYLYHDLNIKRLYAFIANKYLLLYPLLINVKKTFTKDIRKCAPYLLTCCETFCCGGQIANNFSNLSSASFTFHSIASLISSQGFGNTDTKRTFAQWYFFIKLVFCFLSLYAGCWQQLYGNTNTSTNANPHKIQ